MPKGNHRQGSPEFHASLISEAAPFAGRHQEHPSPYYHDNTSNHSMPGRGGEYNHSQTDVPRSAGSSSRVSGPRDRSAPHNVHPLNPMYASTEKVQDGQPYAPPPGSFGGSGRTQATPSPFSESHSMLQRQQ